MALSVDHLVVGPIETNCYIVDTGGHVMVVDPGFDSKRILDELAGRKPEIIAITHRHWDHIQAVPDLVRATGAQVVAYVDDADAIADPAANGSDEKGLETDAITVDRRLADGDTVELGDARFEVLHTPGHSVESMCLYEPVAKALFSGDTLFAGASVGRCDLPTGSRRDIVRSCHEKLAPLPDDTVVYPGHGPFSTIGTERAINSLLR